MVLVIGVIFSIATIREAIDLAALEESYSCGINKNIMDGDSAFITYQFVYGPYDICVNKLDYLSISGFSLCEKCWDNNDTLWCGRFVRSRLLCIFDSKGRFFYTMSGVIPEGFIEYWDSYIYSNQKILQDCADYSMEKWKKEGYKGSYQEFIVVLPFDSCYILKMDIKRCINSGLFTSYEGIVLYNILTYFYMFKHRCAYSGMDK